MNPTSRYSLDTNENWQETLRSIKPCSWLRIRHDVETWTVERRCRRRPW